MLKTRILTLAALALTLFGAFTGALAQDEDDVVNGLAGSSWRLLSFGAGDEAVLSDPDTPITLRFMIEEFEGHGGCNGYGGTYTADGSAITLTDIASTRMACADEALTAQESQYFAALEAAVAYRLTGDRLILSSGDGQTLVFEAAGAYALLNSQWQLVSMGESGALVEVPAESVITLEFPSADEFTGYGGCNGYSGPYTADDEHITFNEVIATLVACEDQDIMDRELEYFDILPAVTRFEIGDGRLSLYTEDDAHRLSYVPSGAYALRRSRWQLTGYTLSGGEPTAALDDAPVTIEFMSPVDAGGSAGCNQYSGTYSTEDDTISFGDVVSTLMACADDAVMDQEAGYLAALREVERYEVVGGMLILHTPDGRLEFAPASGPVVSGAA